MFVFLEHSVWSYVFAWVTCEGLKDRKYSRWKSFSKTLMFLRSIISKIAAKRTAKKKKITQNKWSEKSPSVPFVARQKTLLLRSLHIDASNYHASHVIWNCLLLHTSKVFPRLNTYNRNLTFLKARENSHDFNAEGFSKTCRFIWDHF